MTVDFYGKPGLFIETKNEREIYEQGFLAIEYSILFLTLAGLALLFITILLLEKIIIKRILKFNARISEIAKSHDFSKRTEDGGGDEISEMSADINSMLKALDRCNIKPKN